MEAIFTIQCKVRRHIAFFCFVYLYILTMFKFRQKNVKNFLRFCSTRSNKSYHLEPAYKPANVETRQKKNVALRPLSGTGDNSEVFSMVFPPPNVTGYIHLGHCLTATIQDVISRHKQSQGQSVVWTPGMDHAGELKSTLVF